VAARADGNVQSLLLATATEDFSATARALAGRFDVDEHDMLVALVALSPAALHFCPEHDCPRSVMPYDSASGLANHRNAAHGLKSESKWALQKREVRARKRDPANAPPRRRPGPAPGASRTASLCGRCRGEKRPTQLSLPFDAIEKMRRRLTWVVDNLAPEIGTDRETVLDALQVLAAARLAPPRSAGRRVAIADTLRPVLSSSVRATSGSRFGEIHG